MCDRPQNDGANTWACGNCNKCLTARKNDWIVRCMAETAVRPHCLVIGLTYRDMPDGSKPHQASSFNYPDVQAFFARIRAECKRREIDIQMRYIVAGERGSQRDRVHWHCAIWTSKALDWVGTWRHDSWRQEKAELPLARERRYQWNHWPHGHVYIEEDNENSFAYMLKYALKDQFRAANSKGTSRFTKSEQHGSGMFRMSKEPPIGLEFLERQLASWARQGRVPVTLDLKVPGYKGYWHPKRAFRERLCLGLHEIAHEVKDRTGQFPRQWAALLASVNRPDDLQSDERLDEPDFQDYERLTNGKATQAERLGIELRKNALQRMEKTTVASGINPTAIEQRCGGPFICRPCFHGLTEERKQDFKDWCAWVFDQAQGQPIEQHYRDHQAKRCNPFCGLRDTERHSRIFNASEKQQQQHKRFVKDAQHKMQREAERQASAKRVGRV